MKLLTTKQVVARIAIIIALAELVIMLTLGVLHHDFDLYNEAIIDVLALIVLSTPPLIYWVIRPFVKARDEALAQISHLAHIDPLTHLANRRLLSSHLERTLAGIARHRIYGALLLLDLDRFKPINDTHGHDAGDAVLVEMAQRLQAVARSEDVVGRLGGDEFVVLINHLDMDERTARDKVQRIAAKLLDTLQSPYAFGGRSLCVGASIGVRLLGPDDESTETVIREADLAMYNAKGNGGGHAVIFEPRMAQ